MTEFDLEDIAKHVANMDDGDIIRIASQETGTLRSGVLEIIQSEIIKRNLNPNIIKKPTDLRLSLKQFKKEKIRFNLLDFNIKTDLKNIPLWLKLINGVNLLPILVFPITFIFSVFLFDNPNVIVAMGNFILVNSYPFILIGSVILSFKLYKMNKILLSFLVPIIMTLLLVKCFHWFFH